MRYGLRLVVLVFFSACTRSGYINEIVVTKKLETSLKRYKIAYIDAQNDSFSDPKLRRLNSWATFTDGELCKVFWEYGTDPHGEEAGAV